MRQKTVFISYRRTQSKNLARSIYMDLHSNGWDAFLDVKTIDSGDFDRIILNQIGARAHFVLLISKDSLKRCVNADDPVLKEIEEAIRLKRNIVPIVEEDAKFEDELSYLPENVRLIIEKKNALPLPHYFFDPAMEMLRTRFLKIPEYVKIEDTPAHERDEVRRRLREIENSLPGAARKPHSVDLMPAPFNWIEIPDKSYSIAQYPITNSQYRKFMEAGGYENPDWWTIEGWERRLEGWHYNESTHRWEATGTPWTQPLYWTEDRWNRATQPVVGVSWFEAIAFCLWLSDATGETIRLPAEAQWQYAAQGDDGRTYPWPGKWWGSDWRDDACNNNIANSDRITYGHAVTTSVTDYQGKGDSPFGVVDMAGNVWEWCLTSSEKTEDIHCYTDYRVARGGAWSSRHESNFRCDHHQGLTPHHRRNDYGFRICRT